MSEVFSAISRAIDYIQQNYSADSMPELKLLVSINQEIIDTPAPLKLIITNGSISEYCKERFFEIQFKRTSDFSEKNSLSQFYNLLTLKTPEYIKGTYWEIRINDKKIYKSHTSELSLHLYDIRPDNLKQFLILLISTLYPDDYISNIYLMLLEDPDVIAEFYSM